MTASPTSLAPELTPEQERAASVVLERLSARERETVLVGPAGTGKTTLLRALIARARALRRQVVACTPTGKAALRLMQVTGYPAATIHRSIYTGADDGPEDLEHPERPRRLVFGSPRPPCEPGGVVIVDEGSMVGSELYADLLKALPARASLVVVADHEQLEPVNDRWGPDLLHPHAQLTEIHRQAADNPIIGYATAVRQSRGGEWRRGYAGGDGRLEFREGASLEAVAAWAVEAFRAGEDATVLTWTHRVREALNGQIREGLGLHGRLVPGDRLVVRMNSYAVGLVNGEVVEVEAASPCSMLREAAWEVRFKGLREPVRVLDRHLNDRSQAVWTTKRRARDAWDEERLVHAWHGFCLTIHSAQGSQWSKVGLVVDEAVRRLGRSEPEAARRMVYTGVTRAADQLVQFRTAA